MGRIRRIDLDKEYNKRKSIYFKTNQIDDEILELQKKRAELQKDSENCNKTLTAKGLQYYTAEKRQLLLDKAERLCYSKTSIERMREIGEKEWNMDSVTNTQIEELMAIEDFVTDNTPLWSRSIIAKLGGAFLPGGNETNED